VKTFVFLILFSVHVISRDSVNIPVLVNKAEFLCILSLFSVLRLSVYTCGVFFSRICVANSCHVPAMIYFGKRGVTANTHDIIPRIQVGWIIALNLRLLSFYSEQGAIENLVTVSPHFL